MIRAQALGYTVIDDIIHGPDNYKYKILSSINGREELFVSIGLRSSNLEETKKYWNELLGMQILSTPSQLSLSESIGKSLTVGYSSEETFLHFIQFDDHQPVNHALSGGRIAFACQSVPEIFEKVLSNPVTLLIAGR